MADISGTFRGSDEADTTVRQLKEAGFTIEQIGIAEAISDLSVATGHEAAPRDTHTKRVMVTVHAGSRTFEARKILEQCGGYDINVGDEVERAVREPVQPEAETPFGVAGDVANGLT